MKVAIIKERRADERRVAASPDSVKHMVAMGLEPVVESGAGAEAYFADAAYRRPAPRSSAMRRRRSPTPISSSRCSARYWAAPTASTSCG